MLNLDMSKALPREAVEYLVALLPGLFFEFSVLLANPQLIGSRLNTAQTFVRVPPYLELAMALFFALTLGSAFMMLVSYVRHLHCSILGSWLSARVKLDRKVGGIFTKLARKYPTLNQRSLFQRLWGCLNRATQRHIAYGQHGLGMRAWRGVARKLLHDRYGLDIDRIDRDWELFYWNLGPPSAIDYRGPLLMMALHATGWSGVVATVLAPALWNRYYLALCALLIVLATHSDHYVALRNTLPEGVTGIRLRSLLREFDRQLPPEPKAKNPPELGED
jgi:hypothetical protein